MDASPALADFAIENEAVEMEVHHALERLGELYNYNHWIYNKIRPFIKGSVCEIGSGIGNITRFLLSQPAVVGIEPFPQSIREAGRRFADHHNVKFLPYTLQQCPNDRLPAESSDTVICLNVLEHIAEDVDALNRMRSLCRKDGRVIILVPAHMSAYGAMDTFYGHVRRYNRRSLQRAFQEAGLNVVDGFYMNALGYFGWVWAGRILRRKRISFSAAHIFNRLVPFVDALERIIKPPFGQSIVMIGTPS